MPSFKLRKTNSISFKLARIAVITAFLVGIVLSMIQLIQDYQQESNSLDNYVNRVLLVAETTAARAVHTLDDNLATEVTSGLMKYDFIVAAGIYDEFKTPLSEVNKMKTDEKSETWVLGIFDDRYRNFLRNLSVQSATEEIKDFGYLYATIDLSIALDDFMDRSVYVLLSGVVRNLILVFLLFFVYHYMIAKPLGRAVNEFSELDISNDENIGRIPEIKGHLDDELGNMIDAANAFIAAVEENNDKRRTSEKKLKKSELQTRQIMDTVPNHIYAKDKDGRFVFANVAIASAYDMLPDELVGELQQDLHKKMNEEEANKMASEDAMVIESGHLNYVPDQKFTDKFGKVRILQSYKIPFNFYNKQCVLVVAIDVTDRVEAENRFEKLAYEDSLTNLPNRNLIYDRLKQALARSRRSGKKGALLFVDLDDFKRINDSMGHNVGDQLLQLMANRCQNAIRDVDTLGRLGGDEFIVILSDLDEDESEAVIQAEKVSAVLIESIGAPLEINNRTLKLSASVGITMYPAPGVDPQNIIQFADTAMYYAKSKGKNRSVVFVEEMTEKAEKQLAVESEIRRGLAMDQFEFFLQPVFNAVTEELISAEALMRWRHPDRGLIPPFEFISVMENSDLIIEASNRMLQKLCKDMSRWDDSMRLSTIRISFNVSPNHLMTTTFVDSIQSTLLENGIDGKRFEIEITENAAMENLEETVAKIKALEERNISVAMDDFGTGHASLSHLKQLPFHKLKIDKSFIGEFPSNEVDVKIVQTILDMCKALNLKVVAEGIETEEQASKFREMGEVYLQGYYYEKPIPIDEFYAKYK